MCDLLSLWASGSELVDAMQVQADTRGSASVSLWERRGQVRPTDTTPVLLGGEQGQRRLINARWGLFPFWVKYALCADFDRLRAHKQFSRMVTRQRCIVPCSGFSYVQHKTDGALEAHFRLREEPIFAVAAMYEIRKDVRGTATYCVTLITTPANALISPYSPVMPAILAPEDASLWLASDGTFNPFLRNLLYAYPASGMAQSLRESSQVRATMPQRIGWLRQ